MKMRIITGTTAALFGLAACATTPSIDFGDNTSRWANDGECDDPRFEGPGTDDILLDSDRMRDANDCRAAFEAGTISLVGATTSAGRPSVGSIDFGDNSSQWANDGECDDPRFTGSGSADVLVSADLKRDANDCRAAYRAGTIRLK